MVRKSSVHFMSILHVHSLSYASILFSYVSIFRYATNATIKMHSVLIHDYYSKREPPPIYLTLDCKLKTGQLEIKAYVRYNVSTYCNLYMYMYNMYMYMYTLYMYMYILYMYNTYMYMYILNMYVYILYM